jgi:hypothetical protein
VAGRSIQSLAIRRNVVRVSKGGTDVWWPECREFTTCKGISPADVSGDPDDREQRKYFTEHPDIAFFQRGRRCLACDHEFISTEVEIEFLVELMELRRALGDIKKNAERYTSESKAASKSPSELSKALGVLKTLHVYQHADG